MALLAALFGRILQAKAPIN